MKLETGLSTEELEVISNVAGKFYGGVKWDPRWEFEDLRQELTLFWLKRKQNSWQKPEASQQQKKAVSDRTAFRLCVCACKYL